MRKLILKPLCIAFVLLVFACKATHKTTQTAKVETQTNATVEEQSTSTQPVFVYKTKGDYANLVPVFLSDDKSEIVSYPSLSDINNSTLPTPLKDGYLLDNKGVGKNVAFVNLTYDAYAKLKDTPTLNELYTLILDKDPLIELCDCGKRNSFVDVNKQLNEWIENNQLKTKCKKLK